MHNTHTAADAQAAASDVTLSVVIPALDEEDGIRDILDRVLAIRDDLNKVGVNDLEVIVVDDGSADRTSEIVEATPGATLVRHAVNRGYGAAIKTGFAAARGELLAFLDADSTYPPERFAHLCQVALEENADVVVGSRRSGVEASDMPFVRRLGNTIWSTLLSAIGNATVQDPASGMRVINRRCLQQLYPLPDGLNFTPVMSTRALHEGLAFREVGIPYHERSGRSKLSVVRDGFRFLGTIIWTALQYNPGRFLEAGGGLAVAFAGVIWAVLIAARLNGVTQLEALGVLTVYLSLVLSVGGVSMLCLGAAFNRLVALFHRRPIRQESLISEVFGASDGSGFGYAGAGLCALGLALGVTSLTLGLGGWDVSRLWIWFLGSALVLLVGVHLVLFWGLLRVLHTLDERPGRIGQELTATEPAAALYSPPGSAAA